MSVTKYKTSKGNFWQVRFRYTEKKTGKPEEIQARRDEHGEPFATKNDALAFEAELRRKFKNNGVLKPSRITVAEHCEQWFDVKKVALEATTRQKYRQTLDGQILPALGAIALKDLTHDQIQEWVTNLKRVGGGYGGEKLKGIELAPKTMSDVLFVLHAALEKAVQQGRIQFNPADNIVLPKRRVKEKQVYSADELARILTACEKDDRWYGIMRLIIFSTMRRGELLGLKWDCVNLEHGFIHIFNTRVNESGVGAHEKAPKSLAGIRDIDLDVETFEALKRWQTFQKAEAIALGASWRGGNLATAYLCTKEDGSPFGFNQATRRFKALARTAGVKVLTLHEARHTAITNSERFMSPFAASRRAGHSSLKMTAHYVHRQTGDDKQGAEQIAEMVRRAKGLGE